MTATLDARTHTFDVLGSRQSGRRTQPLRLLGLALYEVTTPVLILRCRPGAQCFVVSSFALFLLLQIIKLEAHTHTHMRLAALQLLMLGHRLVGTDFLFLARNRYLFPLIQCHPDC